MALNILYHFRTIKIIEPGFSKFYYDLLREIDYPSYQATIVRAIQNQLKELITSGKIEVDVRIDLESQLYKPLQNKGYPKDGITYILRDLGPSGEKYVDRFHESDDSSLKITSKGKKWIFETQATDKHHAQVPQGQLDFFDTPDKASDKLKILLKEINVLPGIDQYPNLIGHQLRTILALVLKHICKNVLGIPVPKDKQDLRPLLYFTIEKIRKKNSRLLGELNELKDSKYKDIIDDVIHDDHTTVNSAIIENMMLRIKHILSLAYR